MRFAFFAAASVLGLCAVSLAPHAVHAQVLYTGTLGTTPDAQGWTFAPFLPGDPGAGNQSFVNGATLLQTTGKSDGTATGDNGIHAGYSRISPTILDNAAGYTIRFDVGLLAESHAANSSRAGLSVIVLGSDHRGVELGFYPDQIFSQSTSFTQAETGAFNTTPSTSYFLQMSNATGYKLFAGVNPVGNVSAVPLISGVLRDYSQSGAVPNVYLTPNFLFVGDDTTRAQAVATFSRFEVNPAASVGAPEPSALVLAAGGGFSFAGCLLPRSGCAARRRKKLS